MNAHTPHGLNPAPQDAPQAKIGPKLYARKCRECGAAFTTPSLSKEFCVTACKRTFNNRRLTRAVLFYDLFMSLRYDRKESKRLNVWTLLCRLAQNFRDIDQERREGRPSWRSAKAVLSENPHLYAVATDIRPKRKS